MEASELPCVNPYDVNPISGASPQEEVASIGRPVKLEMEEFSDLAPFLPKGIQKAMTDSADELNTPIFDRKGPFNFMVYENTYIESQSAATDPFKFEYDTIRTGNSVLSNKQLNDFSVYSNNVSVQLQDTNNSEVVNIVQGSEANLLFATSESDQGNIYIINGNETPIHVQSEDHISASIYKIEDTNSFVSVNSNENQYSNVSSPCDEYSVNTNMEAQHSNLPSPNDYYSKTNLGIETPEDSNSSAMSESPVRKIPKLKLELGLDQTVILNTPDVIDSVVDLETTFNILDYVNEKDVTTVNIEDIHFEDPSTSGGLLNQDENVAPKPRKRKIKRSDDDDEDYLPPTKRSSNRKGSFVSFDSDSEEETPPRIKKCRPPRRTSSVCSDQSDANKYRELRDKNNEASRKSRLKRKMKEQVLQKEADELYEKNVKLKAQVTEFERMVNNFRSNLFKIMLKK